MGSLGAMSETPAGEGLRDRLATQGQDALGKLAQDLLENPLVHGALARAFEAREKAAQAQEVAMGALNLPSAADLERLTRRVRSLAQRLEGIEDGVDRLPRRPPGPREKTPRARGPARRAPSGPREKRGARRAPGRDRRAAGRDRQGPRRDPQGAALGEAQR